METEGEEMSARVLGSKYRNIRTEGYASKHEAQEAAKLAILADRGKIFDLAEQVRFDLLPAAPDLGYKRPLQYVADFVWFDEHNVRHVGDAKGFRTVIYAMKKRMMKQMLGIDIEEL